jgi:hypothetical protein
MQGRRLETTGSDLIGYVEDCFGYPLRGFVQWVVRTTQMAPYRSSHVNFAVCWNRHFGQR